MYIAFKRRKRAKLSALEKGAMQIHALQHLSSNNERVRAYSSLQIAGVQDREKGQGILLCKKTNIVGCGLAIGASLRSLRVCISNHNCRGS